MQDNDISTQKKKRIKDLQRKSNILANGGSPHSQAEIEDLRKTMQQMQAENLQLADKCREAEKRNSNLASLYVTSFLLHSSFEYDHVMQSISEVIINLIGCECFGIYLYSTMRNSFVLATGKCLEDNPNLEEISSTDVLLGNIPSGGKMILNPSPAESDFDHPVAVIPLRAMEELIGMLIIYKILAQKQGRLESMDMDLLDLLEIHAGLAIKSSQLYSMLKNGKTNEKIPLAR